MENLIAKIIDIDESAQELIRDAKDSAALFDRELKLQIEELRQELGDKAEGRAEEIRRVEETRIQVRLKELDQKYEAARSALLEKRERNLDQWVDEIYEALLTVS